MSKITSILIAVVVVALGFVGLTHYVQTAYGQTSNLVKVDSAAGASTANGALVLSLLNRINSIVLDGKFLSTPGFQSLEDFSISIAPQPVGRPNPYLPVTGVTKNIPVAKVNTATKSNTTTKTNTTTSTKKSTTPLFFLGN